jgi:hypothetical protein
MTDPDLPPSTPPPTVPPPTPPTTPPTNPPPGPGAPPEPPPLSDGAAPGAYGAGSYSAPGAAAYGAPPTGPDSPYTGGPAGYPYSTGVATPPQTLSLTSFIVGLASLVFCWVPVLGFLGAVAAIVIGFIAKRKEPGAPKWMWLVGIISGFAAILLSLLFLIPFLLLLAFGSAITTNIPIPSA